MKPERRRLEIPQPKDEIKAFGEAIIGQDEAVYAFARLLVSLKSGIRPVKPQPLDTIFLAGPSGVGKTEIVYRLAELLGGNPQARSKVIKLNGGEYKSKAEVARLIGSPPGYIGSEDPRYPGGTKPLLSQESLNSHQISFKDKSGQDRNVVIILVDEAEKADPAVHRALLSAMDHGNLDLANNTSADFRNAVIFFTSNVGNQQVEQLRDRAQKEAAAQDIPVAFREAAGEALAGGEAKETVNEAFKMAFPPEFRGRINDLIIFRNLSEDAISKIIDLKVAELQHEFTVNGVPIKIELDETARAYLIKNGYNPSEGARALEKVIQTAIRDQLILADGSLGLANKTIYIEQDRQTKELAFYFSENPDLVQEVPKPQSAQPPQGSAAQAEANPQRPVQSEGKPEVAAQIQEQNIPQISPTVKAELIKQLGYGLKDYLSKREQFVKDGLLRSGRDANLQPEIAIMASAKLLQQWGYGLDDYIRYRNQLDQAGIFSISGMNNWYAIKEGAAAGLRVQLTYGFNDFIRFRDKLVKAGIGTVEEWNRLL